MRAATDLHEAKAGFSPRTGSWSRGGTSPTPQLADTGRRDSQTEYAPEAGRSAEEGPPSAPGGAELRGSDVVPRDRDSLTIG